MNKYDTDSTVNFLKSIKEKPGLFEHVYGISEDSVQKLLDLMNEYNNVNSTEELSSDIENLASYIQSTIHRINESSALNNHEKEVLNGD